MLCCSLACFNWKRIPCLHISVSSPLVSRIYLHTRTSFSHRRSRRQISCTRVEWVHTALLEVVIHAHLACSLSSESALPVWRAFDSSAYKYYSYAHTCILCACWMCRILIACETEVSKRNPSFAIIALTPSSQHSCARAPFQAQWYQFREVCFCRCCYWFLLLVDSRSARWSEGRSVPNRHGTNEGNLSPSFVFMVCK